MNPEQDLKPVNVRLVKKAPRLFDIVSVSDGKTVGEAFEGEKGRKALEQFLKKNLNYIVQPNI